MYNTEDMCILQYHNVYYVTGRKPMRWCTIGNSLLKPDTPYFLIIYTDSDKWPLTEGKSEKLLYDIIKLHIWDKDY